MILLQVTTDKLLAAFLGAAAALLLKFVYDSVVEYNRLSDIRRIIYVDLCNQDLYFSYMIKDFEEFLLIISGESEPSMLINSSIINTNVFKAHSARDYFKAYSEEQYIKMMNIYSLVDIYSKIVPTDEYKRYQTDLQNIENTLLDIYKDLGRQAELNITDKESLRAQQLSYDVAHDNDVDSVNDYYRRHIEVSLQKFKYIRNDISDFKKLYTAHYITPLSR